MKQKKKKPDLLLNLFLAMTVLDTVIISALVLLTATFLAVAVFMAMGLFLIWSGALLWQMLGQLIRLRLFVAAGFLGTAIIAMGGAVILFTLFVRLIKAYPDVLRFFQRFLLLTPPEKESLSGQVLKTVRKFRPLIFIVFLVLGLGCIILSSLRGGMGPALSFIQRNFSFAGLFKLYGRLLGR